MMGPWMGGAWGGWGGAAGPVLGLLTMVFFWGLLIGGTALLVRWLWGLGQHSVAHADSPLDILRRRYARGEMNKEEFESRRRDLE